MSLPRAFLIQHHAPDINFLYKQVCIQISIAGRLGIEPRLKASKASVLPLDDLPMVTANTLKDNILQGFSQCVPIPPWRLFGSELSPTVDLI